MRSTLSLSILLLALALAVARAEKPAEAWRLIPLKTQDFPAGEMDEPDAIICIIELKNTFPDEAVRNLILAEVDFEKEQLVYFAWTGSGGDRISASTKKDAKGQRAVLFALTKGQTRDRQGHEYFFVIPNDMEFDVR